MHGTPPHVPIAEGAKRIGTTERTLRRWHRDGLATFVAVGPRDRFRITDDEIARLRDLITKPRPVAQ